MKLRFALVVSSILVAAATTAMAASESARVSRATITGRESALDTKIRKMWDDNPFALSGSTRGLYLEGFGAVFTAEVLPVSRNQGLMSMAISADEKVAFRKKKAERLGQLKAALKTALVETAAALDPVPAEEQVAISVYIYKYPWEDSAGMAGQITVQGQRKRLMEVQNAKGAGIDLAVKVTEN